MLLTIHNLPTRTQYTDVKDLIISKCGLKEIILDNLQNEGSGTRVTVGVAEEEDAAILVRKINGIYYRGQQLYVEDKRQKKESEQPYRTTVSQQPHYLMQPSPSQPGYTYNSQVQGTMGMYPSVANYALYQSQAMDQNIQNTYMAYGGQTAQQLITQYTGPFNEIPQQPYAPMVQQNLEPEDPYARRSPSLGRNQLREGGRGGLDDGRPGRDKRSRFHSPPAPWDSRGRDEPPHHSDYRDFQTLRGFNQPQDMYENRGPRQHDDMTNFNARDSRGGLSTRGMRGGHSSNSRDMPGGHSFISRDKHGGHSSNSRGMRGGHSLNSREMRGGPSSDSSDMHGGHSSNSRGTRGGHSSNLRGMRGGHFLNSSFMRGGHSSNSSDMRDGPSLDSRDMLGGPSLDSRDMRGGPSSDSRDMRGGHSSNSRGMRGGHSSNFGAMRGGHSSNSRDMRDGYSPIVRESRGDHAPDSRDYAPGMRDDRPRNPKKRRWEECTDEVDRRPERAAPEPWRDQPPTPRQSRPLTREIHEPRHKKFAPPPPRGEPGKQTGFTQTKIPNPISASKELSMHLDKAVGKIMFMVANNLHIVPEFVGPSPLKTQIRKVITGRVKEIAGKNALAPEVLAARYRALYPPKEDFDMYTVVKQIIAEPKKPVVQPKKKALKQKLRQISPGKIPSYPQGSKKLHSQQKQKHKKDMDTLEACEVNETIKKAMNEEADLIGALIEKEFKNPENPDAKIIYARVDQAQCVSQCKKLITYHISRRVTNTGLKLVRVFGHPKQPRRPDLEEFLAKFGCLSLKKCLKSGFYTASFNSFETVDELCKMPPVEIGDQHIKVSFKHMHVAPKKPKVNQNYAKSLRKRLIASLIDKSKVNLLDKDWKIQEEEENKAQAAKRGISKPDNVTLVDNNTTDFTSDEVKTEAKEQQVTKVKESEVTADTNEDNQDFLHVDFKVIDEVRESDNDEIANDAPNPVDEGNGGDGIREDWDETGEDWGDAADEDNGGNVKNEENENSKNNDLNDDDVNKGDVNEGDVNDDDVNEDEENDDEHEVGNPEDIDIADVDWDNVDEDDLEDY